MKAVILLFLGVALHSSISVSVQGQSTGVLEQLPAEEVKKIRDSAEVLAKAFGITDTSRIHGSQGKTFADVGDKALDMIKGMVVSLSETLEKVAPHVWRIMLRQQYAKAIALLVVPIGAMIIIVLYAWISSRLWQFDPKQKYWIDGEDDGPTNRGWRGFFTKMIPVIAGVIAGIVMVDSIRDAALYLINPEYYAIRDLLVMILSPGSIK